MQINNYTKILAASSCAVALWVGTIMLLPQTVSADNQPNKEQSKAETAEPSSTKPEFTKYQVQAGDYLEAIAEKHEVEWPSIFESNDSIANPDLIFPEQTLEIPSKDIPLTRSIANSTLPMPESYAPEPIKPVQQAPKAVTRSVSQPAGYSTPTPQPQAQPVVRAASSGVVGLEQVVGRPYVYGGTSLNGFDCSGLTQYLAGLRGVSLPRTVSAQYHATARIGQADLQPGDLVFFNWNHVGMYIGNGQVVHATNPAQGVRIDNLQTAIQYNGYLGAGNL
jgi:peptidoglycan DL-endopeptidase CwlO